MKAGKVDQKMWLECTVLAVISAIFAILMNKRFAKYKPVVVARSTPEEKSSAEPARQALHQAIAAIDTPEKADLVAEKLKDLAGSATIGEVEQTAQPEMPLNTGEKIAEKSQRIEQAVNTAPPEEKAAQGIAQAAKEITASPGREQAALAEATQETLNPDQDGAPGAANPRQREYLRQAVLKRLKPLDAVDARLFLLINHLPHNRWLNGFFSFFTIAFKAGLAWYSVLALAILLNPRKGVRAARNIILPLSVASTLVEFPIKAFVRRRRPFIDFVHATVIGKKPGSWSFPSGHSAAAFGGAWLLSTAAPQRRPALFMLAGLVGFSRIYLGDHYPGDVLAGALSGMALAEALRRAQMSILPE